MLDPILLVVAAFLIVGGVYSFFAVVSNGRKNVETLEEANDRLVEMREEYQSYRKEKHE